MIRKPYLSLIIGFLMVVSSVSLVSAQTSAPVTTNIDSAVQTQGFFQANLGVFVTQIINAALIIGAIATLFYLLIGAIEWITSEGDQNKNESARKRITAAVVGLGVLASVYALWLLVLYFFGINRIPQLNIGGLFGGSRTPSATVSSMGSGSGATASNPCWPFASCEEWVSEFNNVHGRLPRYNDLVDFVHSQGQATQGISVSEADWNTRYENYQRTGQWNW